MKVERRRSPREDRDRRPLERNAAGARSLGLIQGLADLIVDGFLSAPQARTMVKEILAQTKLPSEPSFDPVAPIRRRNKLTTSLT